MTENKDLRKRYKYLQKCKTAVWNRWTKEYLRSLRERYVRKKGRGRGVPAVGEVVIIQSDQKNRGVWTLGIVIDLITGKDRVIRGAKVRTGKSIMERPVQLLYPVELSSDDAQEQSKTVMLNPEAPEFRKRPKRDAAIAASVRIGEVAGQESEDIEH